MKRPGFAWGLAASLALYASCGTEEAPREGGIRSGAPRNAAVPEDPRLALLVAVGEYAGDSQRDENGARMFPDLRGPSQDAELVEQLLRSRFGFRQEDIRVLRDGEATLENVVRAFHEHLIRRATPETEVLFWFSGHGSTVPDPSGAERTGIDNTLVLHDSRSGGSTGERDLPDDALHSLVAALPTRRVTVVTDCCHSGGALRSGEGPMARVAPGGTAVPTPVAWSFWPPDVPLLEDGDPRRATSLRYVHVAACAFDQRAFEINLPEPPPGFRGTEFGALTWFLAREMAAAPPGTSWRTAVGKARLHVAETLPDQQVSVEGGGADRGLFDEEVHETLFGFDAFPGYGGRIQVEAGGLHGLMEGSKVAVYRLGERDPLGHATVTHCRATEATAEWIGEAPELERTEALKVTRGSLGEDETALFVAVEDDEVRGALARIRWLLPVAGEGVGADYRLTRQDDAWTLLAEDGVEIWRSESASLDESARRELEQAAGDEVHFRRIWGLAEAAGAGALSVEARLARPTEEECSNPRFLDLAQEWGLTGFRPLALPETDEAAREVTVRLKTFEEQEGGPGDLVRLDVEAGSHDVFVAILNLDPATRRIQLVYPSVGEPDNVMHAGDTFPWHFSVGAPDPARWPSERPCRDRYLVIATRDREDFSALATRDRTRGGGGADVLDRLAGLDWGVAVVDLVIERER